MSGDGDDGDDRVELEVGRVPLREELRPLPNFSGGSDGGQVEADLDLWQRVVELDDGEQPGTSSSLKNLSPKSHSEEEDEEENYFRSLRRKTSSADDEAVVAESKVLSDEDLLEQYGIEPSFVYLGRKCDDPLFTPPPAEEGQIAAESESAVSDDEEEIAPAKKEKKRYVSRKGMTAEQKKDRQRQQKAVSQRRRRKDPIVKEKDRKRTAAYRQKQLEENETEFRNKQRKSTDAYQKKQLDENEKEFRDKARAANVAYRKSQLKLDADYNKKNYQLRKARREALSGEELAELRRIAILRIDRSTLNHWLQLPAYAQIKQVNFTNYLASLSTVELLDSKYSVLVSEAFLQKKSYCNYWVGGFYWDGIEKLTPIQIETHVVANKNDPAFTMRLYWGYFSNGQRSATYHPSSPSSTVWKMLDDGWRCFELNIFN
ncbi:stress response protein nst1 isoform X2 [Folsomia candida]|uniref:stress response protein nst1 isoform X2 n=1 Tax=Folsomia candida TaxID=158441 RepID=UPI001604CF86|nr:stress response protein nst1 isoform X2 [Folsomia candida]